MTLLLSFWLALFGTLFAGNLQAADLVSSRSMLVDTSGTLSIDEVARAQFTTTGPVLIKGYTDAAHWLRITVQPPAQPGAVVLRIRPSFLDEVRLYEPDLATPGAWLTRVTGDRHSYEARDNMAIALGFLVHPQTATTYYLRLQTTSSSIMNVQALTLREAQLKDLQLDAFALLYLAFMGAILFWAVSDYAAYRQAVTLLFVVQQSVYVLYSLAFMGYLAPFVPTDSPLLADKLTNLLVVAIVGLSALFHRGVLQLYQPPRWLLHICEGLIAVSLVNLAAVYMGHGRVPLFINSFVALSLAPLFMGTALLARQEGAPSLQVIRGIYGLLTLSLAATVLPLLGLVQVTEWNLYALLIHGLIGGALMFVMLYLRSQGLQKQGHINHVALQLAEQQLQLERAQKDEQGRFMLMLTHELKTPMSVVRLALDALQVQGPIKIRADQALQDMNQIVERCQQVEQLEQHGFRIHAQPCDLAVLLRDLKSRSQHPELIELHIGSLPPLHTDPQLLRIVLDNLLNNAVKYAAPDTPITVYAEPWLQNGMSGVRVRLQNLPGIAGLPDAARVFEKYYRSLGAHHQTGSGLGLYLVRSIVTLLGGEVLMKVLPALDGGTDNSAAEALCFTVWVPC